MSERVEISRNLANHLLATEESIDAAIACAAGLAGFMPAARKQARVSASVGQPAFEQVIEAMTMLSQARRSIVEAHQSLADCRRVARVPEHNFGGFVDKPHHHAQSGLTVVGERRAG